MIDIDYDPDFTEEATKVVPKKGVKRKDMIKAAMLIQRNWKEYKKARVAEKWLYLIKLDKQGALLYARARRAHCTSHSFLACLFHARP